MDSLTLHLKQLGKEQKERKTAELAEERNYKDPSRNKWKRNERTILKINKAKNRFLEKINKIGKPLTRLIKKIRKMNQINKIRIEKGEVTTENAEIQRIMSLLWPTIWQ